MWCDNCLLLFPLRAGAMFWAALIFLYSLAGSIILLIRGAFLFFVPPEWYLYAGVGMLVALVAFINIFALGSRSYTWIRVCKYLWGPLIIISGIRAVIMIVELQNGQSKLTWECENGGQIWPGNFNYTTAGTLIPSQFCTATPSSIEAAFIVSLLVDIVCQIYMFFLTWRYQQRIEHYDSMKSSSGGYYS